MSIGKQVPIFMAVSELFLLRSAVESGCGGLSAWRDEDDAHVDHALRIDALLARKTTPNSGSGNGGGNSMPARVQNRV